MASFNLKTAKQSFKNKSLVQLLSAFVIFSAANVSLAADDSAGDLLQAQTAPQQTASQQINPHKIAPPQQAINHPELKPYSIKYKVIHDGDKVGTASRSLEKLSNGQWQLSMQSKVKYYFFSDERQETSRFVWDNGLFLTQNYQRLTDTSLKSDTNLIQNFDWEKGIETGSYKDKKWSQPIEEGIADQLTELEVVRHYLKSQKPIPAIDISYRGSIRHHEFQVVTQETLKTAKGEFKTAKLLLNEKKRKRQTYFWLSLDGEFLPLQIQRIKKGEEEAKLVATEW